MGVIPPAFLKGPSRCFGALEGGQVFGLFVVVRCAGVHCYVNEVHLQHFSISNLVLALLYHTFFNKGTCFLSHWTLQKKGRQWKQYLPRFKRFSRCFEAVFCTAIIVLILGQDVDREPVIVCDVKEKLWRHLLGYERAGIFCDGERVVVPRLLSHVEDAWDKGF